MPSQGDCQSEPWLCGASLALSSDCPHWAPGGEAGGERCSQVGLLGRTRVGGWMETLAPAENQKCPATLKTAPNHHRVDSGPHLGRTHTLHTPLLPALLRQAGKEPVMQRAVRAGQQFSELLPHCSPLIPQQFPAARRQGKLHLSYRCGN